MVVPGDTVSVAAGNYAGPITLSTSGTPSHPINWVGQASYSSRVSATSGSSLRVVEVSGAYVQFRGFDVTGSGSAGTVGIDVKGSYSEAIGNRVHDLAIPCVGSDGGAGIDLSGDETGSNQKAIGNLVTNIGAGARDGRCRGVHGIYVSVTNVVVENNIIENAIGDGVESYHYASNLTIANNTSVGNGGWGILISGNEPPYNRGSYVVNNITTSNVSGGIAECCDATRPSGTHYIDNQLFGNGGSGGNLVNTDGLAAEITGTLTSNPLFVNQFAGDFHLRVGSSALNSGTSSHSPPFDFNYERRPGSHGGYDRGAYQQ